MIHLKWKQVFFVWLPYYVQIHYTWIISLHTFHVYCIFNAKFRSLLALACSVILPVDKMVRKYLLAHLKKCSADFVTEEGKYARFAEKVQSTWSNSDLCFIFLLYLSETRITSKSYPQMRRKTFWKRLKDLNHRRHVLEGYKSIIY